MFLSWGPEQLVFFNDAYRPILGQRVAGAIGQPFDRLWAEIWSDIAPIVDRTLAGEGATFNDLPLTMTRNGFPEETRWSFTYMPLRDADGAIRGLLCTTTETTEGMLTRRGLDKAVLALSDSEAQQRGALRIARLGTFEWHPGTNAASLNERSREIFGLDASQDLTAEDVFGRIHPDDLAHVQTVSMHYVERREAFSIDYRIVLPGGEIRTVTSLGEFLRDPGDEVGRMVGVFADITERVNAQADLEQQVAIRTAELRLYRNMVESDTSPILAFDTTRRLIGFNRTHRDQFRQVMGLEQQIGDNLPDLFPAEQAAMLRSLMDRALAGEAFTVIQEFGDKEKPTWEINYTPLRDEAGAIIGAFHHARDISARVQAEAERDTLQEQLRQSQKMEAVGQLTGGLAHDFNNLLAVISGSLELLERRIIQGRISEIERFVVSAQSAAKRASALTHRLLAFSRRQTLDPRPTGVNQLIAGMDDLLRRTVGPAITVETVGAAGLWNTLVDPSQLENALLNLCINARDAMPDGGRLTVETANRWLDERAARERDMPPGQYVSLCVSDTGTGMPPDVVAKAFDPFFTTKPIGQGTGLGLSMIYGFARQSGGQVRIYSEVGQGTTICIYLPRHYGEAEASDDAAQPAPGTALEGETVLVVDDEPGVRMLVAEVLSELGYAIIEAEDGPSALKVVSSKARIDLLVTDVGLPNGMNGRQVADAARVARPGLKVLFITGYAENAVVGNGHLDPGMAVITKPFAVDALANRIKDLIAQAPAGRTA